SVVLPEPAGPSTHTTRASDARIRSSTTPSTAPVTLMIPPPGLPPVCAPRRPRRSCPDPGTVAGSAGPDAGPLLRLRPEAELRGALLGRLDLLTDPRRGGAPDAVARRERALDRQHRAHVRREVLRDAGEVLVGQVPQLDP